MTARVLVVDPIFPNRRILASRLEEDYLEVETTDDSSAVVDICRKNNIDVVTMEVMLVGRDGFQVCKDLKSNPATSHIPVIMVTALDQTQDRIRGLESGADDFLTKPVDIPELLARVRSLARTKQLVDELLQISGQMLSTATSASQLVADLLPSLQFRCLILEDDVGRAKIIASALQNVADVTIETDPDKAIKNLENSRFDAVVISFALKGADGMRICSRLRADPRFRNLPILAIMEAGDRQGATRAIERVVNDYVFSPVDAAELSLRTRNMLRGKQLSELLRTSVENTNLSRTGVAKDSHGSSRVIAARGSKIFISYRRNDTRHIAGRIYDRLIGTIPESEIFFDVVTIPMGVKFTDHITTNLAQCAVVIVLVGNRWAHWAWRLPGWLGRILWRQQDFVRTEVEQALALGLPIIPVLVDGAQLPPQTHLPPRMRDILAINAAHVSSGRNFHTELDSLAKRVTPWRDRGLQLVRR